MAARTRELQVIGACNRLLMHAVDEPALLNDICRLVCDQAGYRLAWVGYAVNDAARTVRIAARAGDDDGYLAATPLSWDDSEQGRNPAGLAIRTGVTCATGGLSTDRPADPWSRHALARGFRSCLALPLKDADAGVFGALNLLATEPEVFTPEEIRFLEELAGELSFGLTALRARHEHRQAEEKLRRSERGLAEAQRIVHLGNWELDLVRNELSWSDEIFRIFEIDPGKFAASYEAFLNAIHPEDRDRVNQAYTDSLKHKAPYEIVHRLLMPDGRIKYVSERCETYYDETGRPVRSVGTVHDITGRKQAESALRRYAEEVQDLYDHAPCGYHSLAEDGTFLRINDTELAWLGYTREEVLGKMKFSDLLTPQGRAAFQQEFPAYKARGWVRDVEFDLVRKNGTTFPVLLNSTAIKDAHDRFVMGRSVLHDITERKHADAINAARLHLMQFATSHSSDELLEATLDEAEKLTGSRIGFYHFVNDDQVSLTFQNWSSRTKAEFCRAEGKGRHYAIDRAGVWVECIHQRGPVVHNDYASLPHRKGLPPGHAPVIRELVVPVLRGEKIRAILGVGNKPADYMEEDVRTVSLLADLAWEIAERKRAEERVRELNTELEQRVEARTRQLQEANRELVEFSYSMSHDLRTPLRSIDGFSQALLEDCADRLDDAGKAHLQTVRAASQRMGLILDAMVGLLRINRREMHLSTVNLSELAARIATARQQAEPGRDVAFVIAPGCEVRGDAGLLKIALENLLDNAWKYTGRTHPARIEFGRAQVPGAPAFFVWDNGEGFDMDYVGKLFVPFQRLHTGGEFPGTGVGLAIVQRIIRRHGGRVWAEGRPGHGATFYFSLPDQPHAIP